MISLSYNVSDTYIKINTHMLDKYKDECDAYLINMKRELTRCLVDYHMFRELQSINNGFFKIINGLYNQKYTHISELIDDKHKLHNNCDVFIKHCKSILPKHIYDSIFNNCQKLNLNMIKLVEIAREVSREESNVYTNI